MMRKHVLNQQTTNRICMLVVYNHNASIDLRTFIDVMPSKCVVFLPHYGKIELTKVDPLTFNSFTVKFLFLASESYY